MRVTQLATLLLAATSLPAQAARLPEKVWGPAVQRIQIAANIQNPEAREVAVRAALRDGLIASSREVADQVFTFLSESTRWIDLRPFSDVLEEFAETDPTHRGRWLLDDNELAHSPLEIRKSLYRQALEEGTIRLRRGAPLTRASAIVLAAFDGMRDLQPLIERYAPLVDDRWKQSFQLNSIPALMELTRDASDRDSAAEKAATRLAAMSDESLRSRMDADAGFRTAVTQMTDYLCAKDPFSGDTVDGCQKVKEVVERQTSLEKRTLSAGQTVAANDARPARAGWLERWRERIE